jgi:predicted negative regulator of RcsB-dependent stress response
MTTSTNLLLAGLVLVVLLWVGLGIWRNIAARHMQKMEQAYTTHYSTQQTDKTQNTTPVIWDFDKERLVKLDTTQYAVVEAEGDSTFTAVAVQAVENEESSSKAFWMSLGFLLERVPAAWFHGIFAGLTLIMGYILARGRG